MDYGGPDRQENRRTLLDAAESIRETIIAGAEQAEADMTIPPASVDALYDSGLFGLKLPEVLGGAEADPITQLEVIEAVALYDSSASWCMMIGATNIGTTKASRKYSAMVIYPGPQAPERPPAGLRPWRAATELPVVGPSPAGFAIPSGSPVE